MLLGVVVPSACSSSPDASSSSPTPSSSSPSASLPPSASATPSPDATAAAREAALAAYRGFREAQVAAEAKADAHYAELAKYAGDKALAQERANLLQLAEAGIVVTGKPILSPEVTAVSLGSSPVVTITEWASTASK